MITQAHPLTLDPVMWSRDGAVMTLADEDIFRYKVVDGPKVVGYITTDRARSHPRCRWEITLLAEHGRIKDVEGDYATARDAFAAFPNFL